jgi:hypothetical protein
MVTNEDGDLVRSFTYEARPGQEWGEIVLNKDLSVSEDSNLWSNYNEYLLTDREDGESPLRTRVRPISSNKNMLAFRSEGGYLEFDNNSKRPLGGELGIPEVEDVTPVPTVEDIENVSNEPTQQSSEVENIEDSVAIINEYSNSEIANIVRNSNNEAKDYLGKLISKTEQDVVGGKAVQEVYEHGTIQRIFADDSSKIERLIDNSGKARGIPLINLTMDAMEAGLLFDGNENFNLSEKQITEFFNSKFKPAQQSSEIPGKLSREGFLMFTSLELPSNKYVQETYAEELKRAQGMTPATIKDVTKFVSLIDGTLLGKLNKDGKILVTELAPGGTAYHEAFHSVSLRLLSQEDSDNLYTSVKNIQGESIPYQEIIWLFLIILLISFFVFDLFIQ